MKRTKDRPTILSLRRELTPEEFRVTVCILRGYSNADTARALNTTERNVRTQKSHIFAKTGFETAEQLIVAVMTPLLPDALRAVLSGPL